MFQIKNVPPLRRTDWQYRKPVTASQQGKVTQRLGMTLQLIQRNGSLQGPFEANFA
jgi:hypothetical protein